MKILLTIAVLVASVGRVQAGMIFTVTPTSSDTEALITITGSFTATGSKTLVFEPAYLIDGSSDFVTGNFGPNMLTLSTAFTFVTNGWCHVRANSSLSLKNFPLTYSSYQFLEPKSRAVPCGF